MIKVIYFGAPQSLTSNLLFEHLMEGANKYQNIEVIAVIDASRKSKAKSKKCTKTLLDIKTYLKIIYKLYNTVYNRYRYGGEEKFKAESLFKIAKKNKISIITPENFDVNNKAFLAKLKNLNPDLLLLCGCGQIIKDDFLNSFSNKIINFHPALLPEYAGFGALIRPILSDEQKAGVTFHYVTKIIDGGDIVVQKAVKIDSDENGRSLHSKLLKAACKGMTELVRKAANGKLPKNPQDLSKRCYYTPKDLEKLLSIDWNSPYHENLRRFKVFNYLYLPKKGLPITDFKKVGDIKSQPKDVGKVVSITMKGIKVIGSEDIFLIKELGHLPAPLSVCLAKFHGIREKSVLL